MAKVLKTVAEALKLQRKVWASQNCNTGESPAKLREIVALGKVPQKINYPLFEREKVKR